MYVIMDPVLLRQARVITGLSQRAAAREAGISKRQYQRIEDGDRTTNSTALAIAQALGTTLIRLGVRPAPPGRRKRSRINADAVAARATRMESLPKMLSAEDGFQYSEMGGVALREVAAAYARTGDTEEAMRLSTRLFDSEWRAEVLGDICEARVSAGDISGGIAIASGITSEPERTEAFVKAAVAAARAGKASAATRIARKITVAAVRSHTTCKIASAHADSGRIPTAIRIAKAIEDAGDRAGVFAAIARTQLRTGDDGAKASIKNALV